VNRQDRVAVTSRSFSRHPVLRSELLQKYAHVTFNDAGVSLKQDGLVNFLSGHSKAITALERIDRSVLERLPDLQVIGKYGVGLDMIDIQAMRDLGKRLGWTAGVNKRSVAELVLCFAIAMLRHVPAAYREIASGTWRQHMGGELSARTVGIIGCGHVGKEVVRLLRPFGCAILVHDIRDYPDFYDTHQIKATGLEEVLAHADVVTIHVPLEEATHNMLDARRIGLMKRGSILINAARGGLVDEAALKEALINRRIAGAAFDVFVTEPPEDAELIALPNFLCTPHIGGSSEEAILAMGRAAVNGLDHNEIP
jgi:phosphoglycerate dehydrogenase-like enzyme